MAKMKEKVLEVYCNNTLAPARMIVSLLPNGTCVNLHTPALHTARLQPAVCTTVGREWSTLASGLHFSSTHLKVSGGRFTTYCTAIKQLQYTPAVILTYSSSSSSSHRSDTLSRTSTKQWRPFNRAALQLFLSCF